MDKEKYERAAQLQGMIRNVETLINDFEPKKDKVYVPATMFHYQFDGVQKDVVLVLRKKLVEFREEFNNL